MPESTSDTLFPEAMGALRAAGRRVEWAHETLSLYRIDDGLELTTGGVIALAFRLGLIGGDAPAQ